MTRDLARQLWTHAQNKSELVSIASLKPMQRFITSSGLLLRYKHGGDNRNVHCVTDDTGAEYVYGSTAEVLPLAADIQIDR